MKITIESISPDGLIVKIETPFVVDTMEEAFEIIRQIEKIGKNY